eukprot:134972-Rhodomonas_salina.4
MFVRRLRLILTEGVAMVPGNTNPAEYLLDLVNAEFTNPEDVEVILKVRSARLCDHNLLLQFQRSAADQAASPRNIYVPML